MQCTQRVMVVNHSIRVVKTHLPHNLSTSAPQCARSTPHPVTSALGLGLAFGLVRPTFLEKRPGQDSSRSSRPRPRRSPPSSKSHPVWWTLTHVLWVLVFCSPRGETVIRESALGMDLPGLLINYCDMTEGFYSSKNATIG